MAQATLVETNAATLVELLHREMHRQDCPLTLDAFFQEWQAQRQEQQKDNNEVCSVECNN